MCRENQRRPRYWPEAGNPSDGHSKGNIMHFKALGAFLLGGLLSAGPVFAAAGTVFIDRFDHDKAVVALKPVVESIRQGLSLVLAPEGTRSPTPCPGRFKKGAFHMAMAAGVPIVPIVLRNTLDALPKHGIIVRPATIEVVVHPPIPTADWKAEDLDRHIEKIRQLYLDTLRE